MSEQITLCPSCKSIDVRTVSIYNPDTSDMNCEARLACNQCLHEWDGLVTSPKTEEWARLGFIRL
jgi:hypothetical protein